MKHIIKYSFIYILAGLTLVACKKDDDDPVTPTTTSSPVDNLEFIFTADVPNTGLTVSFYADEALFVGYNKVYAQITETATEDVAEVTDADLSIQPMMEMPTMMHSCPFGNMSFDTELGLYTGHIVFIMGTMTDGTWTIDLNVANSNGESGDQSVEVEVVNPAESKVLSFVNDSDQKSYFITMIQPSAPEIGVNKFQVGVYVRENMMSFPASEDLNITIEPEMPSMGHGSPFNVNPVHVGSGIYTGEVNFTMGGDWRINLEVMDSDMNVMKTGIYFDIGV